MGQGYHGRGRVAAIGGDEERREFPAHLDSGHGKPGMSLHARVTHDYLEAQGLRKLRTGHRYRGDARDDQPCSRSHADGHRALVR
ncbi:hypothetical protein D9M68_794470 [compost metagenome]